jgi:tRNA U34 5-methylaminomethyl-2-thiouridine-forming methyltransferase MnmC
MNELITTEDGSHTIISDIFKASYHSIHGAIQETDVVFINAGYNFLISKGYKFIKIFEVGFGTGLNAYRTLLANRGSDIKILYTCIEPYPLNKEEYEALNYYSQLKESSNVDFLNLHEAYLDVLVQINPSFELHKINSTLQDFRSEILFDLVYFDAFAPNCQPDLWSKDMFEKVYQMMNSESVLVTYCAKGEVKRNLKSCGFIIESLPGPGRKREITRAIKTIHK